MSFSELPYELFIQAEQPEVKMLAVLGNMGSADPYAVTESIVRDIDQRPTPVSEKYKRINQLRIIVQLRNFERQFQIAMSKAATFFKEERDPFYKRGEAKGIEKGMEKGIEKERAKAYTEKLNSARKMKESGFADQLIADILELPVETVHELK